MHVVAYILGASDDDNISKLVGFGVVAAIWIISAIANAAKKQQEQKRREQVRLEVQPRPAPPAPPRAPAPLRGDAQHKATVRQKANRISTQQTRQVASIMQPVLQRAAATAAAATATPPPSIATSASASRPRVAVDARVLSTWLTPKVMHRQFILTEILQPPIALREQHL